MKKIISFAVSVAISVTVLAGYAFAAEGVSNALVNNSQSFEDINFDSERFIHLSSATVPLGTLISIERDGEMQEQEEVVADIDIYQEFSTTRIFTQVTVKSTKGLFTSCRFESFEADVEYHNYSDFEIPPTEKSIRASAKDPTWSLSGSTYSPAQISGHRIKVIVTITDVQLSNGTIDFSPVSYSDDITIR